MEEFWQDEASEWEVIERAKAETATERPDLKEFLAMEGYHASNGENTLRARTRMRGTSHTTSSQDVCPRLSSSVLMTVSRSSTSALQVDPSSYGNNEGGQVITNGRKGGENEWRCRLL